MDDPYGFRFREWQVYKDGRVFRTLVLGCCRTFPANERFALFDQVSRALSSILLNVAEGSNRKSDKDTCVFVRRALGSLDEVIACIDSAQDSEYLSKEQHATLLEAGAGLAKQLRAFATYLAHTSGSIKE